MDFHTFGNSQNPAIMLIHGGGGSWWNFLRQARKLENQYFIILPTLDGHASEYDKPYISTEAVADNLLAYIDNNCGGKLFALCGVSLGGQIVAELLSRKPNIAKKAIIDGAICYPQPILGYICSLFIKLFGRFMFSEKACKKQIKNMPKKLPEKMQFTDEIKKYYLQDMPRFKIKTLLTIYKTYLMNYRLKDRIKDTQAEVMFWYGEKEMWCVKKSAKIFKATLTSTEIYIAKGYGHGYLALFLPDEWLDIAIPFFDKQ